MGIISEGSREAFRATIDRLKELAQQESVVVSDQEIARNLGITIAKFKGYYDSDTAPNGVFLLLREKYRRYIGNILIHHIWVTDVKEVDDPDPDSEVDDSE